MEEPDDSNEDPDDLNEQVEGTVEEVVEGMETEEPIENEEEDPLVWRTIESSVPTTPMDDYVKKKYEK